MKIKVVMRGNEINELEESSYDSSASASREKEGFTGNNALQENKKKPDNAIVIAEAINRGLSAFTPSLLFEQIVRNYKHAKEIYGERLLAEATGYSANSLERNIRLPEVRREIEKKIQDMELEMKAEELLEKNGIFTEKAIEMATLVLYAEELDQLAPTGITGERGNKKTAQSGIRGESKPYTKERYRDIALKKSIKKAIRRNHVKEIQISDLYAHTREDKGKQEIIYCLDASGSMKGEKIRQGRRAGLALAYKAINQGDAVGLLVFGSEIREHVPPTKSFPTIARKIISTTTGLQTNIAGVIEEAVKLFSNNEKSKHIILLTDALPTAGTNPEEKTVIAVGEAREKKIILSVVGINLNEKGKQLAEKIATIGEGRIFSVQHAGEINSVVLQDYYTTTDENTSIY